MKLGLYTDMRNPFATGWSDHYGRWLDRIAMADGLGAGEVWLSEHHLYDDGYLPQPLTFAAAIAARTTQIRIGTAVLLAALRHPLQLAEEAALVDIVSGGRLDLGVGVGYRPQEFEAFGEDVQRRYPTLERKVREMQGWWAGGALSPPPVQDPIPLWGGFFGPRGARLAGRLGMGLMPQNTVAHSLHGPYLEGLAEGNHPASTARMRFAVPFFLADDPDEVRPIVEERQRYQLESYQRHDAGGPTGVRVTPNSSSRTASAAKPTYPVLRPAEAAQLITEVTAGLPVDQVFNWTSPGVMPDHLVDRHVELLLTEVAPLVADLGANHDG